MIIRELPCRGGDSNVRIFHPALVKLSYPAPSQLCADMNASEERALATRLGKVDRRAFIPFVRVVPVHVDSGTLAILYQDARAGRGVHREVCALESEISQSTFEARSSTSFQRVARA